MAKGLMPSLYNEKWVFILFFHFFFFFEFSSHAFFVFFSRFQIFSFVFGLEARGVVKHFLFCFYVLLFLCILGL